MNFCHFLVKIPCNSTNELMHNNLRNTKQKNISIFRINAQKIKNFFSGF